MLINDEFIKLIKPNSGLNLFHKFDNGYFDVLRAAFEIFKLHFQRPIYSILLYI